jgi:quercetin dioxygenase-like cupin family protein
MTDHVTSFQRAEGPPDGLSGFRVVAGRDSGLRRLMFVVGNLPAGDHGPMHLHRGDELLRILDGELLVRLGDQRRMCRAGDVVVVPPDVLHGFRASTATTLEVVAEYDIGTIFPVRGEDGERRFVEVFRQDMPWGRRPPDGRWTSDAEMRTILDRLDAEV